MKVLIFFAACLALALADGGDDYKEEPETYAAKAPAPVSRYHFYGRYSGKCGNDGIYYRDAYSFVQCSNGNVYVQPCAPGTRNSGYDHFSYGNFYSQGDFCDINLVDYGYGADKRYNRYDRPYGYYGYDRPYGYYGRGYGGPYYGGYY